MGIDPLTGKEAFVVAQPGGFLEGLADARAIEAATALVAVVSAVLEGGKSSDAELAVLVPALHAALEECVAIMTADRE
ncbi:hypothetical protein [Streptomyces sp. NPDC057616]|uniref:hypothetical protein n=1 Tax=Streptomyces sp. NPDC057616 TaxID=3346183 RepID=UPI0036C7AB32